MEKTMLVTQALDERDFLAKKINSKIDKVMFADIIKNNEEKGYNSKISRSEFEAEAKAGFQQITDLITRYEAIDAAIITSNATTMIHTSFGDYSVAVALAMRNRIKAEAEVYILNDLASRDFREPKNTVQNFTKKLIQRMQKYYTTEDQHQKDNNAELETRAENMRLSILGRDSKVKDDKPLAVVDAYIQENRTEIMDPLRLTETIEKMRQDQERLLSELETGIKVSNATTMITI